MNRKVLIAAPVHPVLTDGLLAMDYELVSAEDITQESAMVLIWDCVGVITSTRLQLNAALLDEAPGLEWIGRMGSGMEVIDVPYATSRGVKCFSSPEGNRNAVAEHTLGLLLSLTKRISWSNRQIADGLWLRDENRGMELEGKTIGLIGFGNTGRAFAHKLSGFDMNILAYDKYSRARFPPNVVRCIKLDQLLEHADIISFHVPLQKDTLHYLNDEFIARAGKPFILLNTSRGGVVDTKALHKALLAGSVTAAGLDVIEEEPLGKMSEGLKTVLNEMMKMPHFVITPHIAGYSNEALYKMSKVILDRIVNNV
jgi:D-3-phosphoglycerate dehydrogenase